MTLYTYTIRWPLKDESIHSIQITGNFDNWSRSLPTVKSTKEYLQQIKLDNKQDVVFKFIINDDQWIVNDQFKVTHDEHGNSNNIIYADELVEESDEVPAEEAPVPVVTKEVEEELVPVSKEVEEESVPVAKEVDEESVPVTKEVEEEPVPVAEEEPEKEEITSDDAVVVPAVSTTEEKEAEPESVPQLDKGIEENGFRIGVPKEMFVEEFEQGEEPELVNETPKEIVSDIPEPNVEEEPEEVAAEDVSRDTVVVHEDHESFVEPDVALKSPSKSIITEDDVISDLDTTGHTTRTHDELPHPSVQQQQQPLTQVLTSSSSFAAISSPPLSSDYEHLEKYDNEEPEQLEDEDDETDYNTAANSGISTEKKDNPLVAAYQENKPVKPVLLTHVSETTIDASSAGETTPKIPGHYPTTPEHKSSSTTSLSSNNNVTQKESTYTGKRESLISRFKSLFR
ncbi:Cruciform DNA-recognizing protein 1 [Candida viswanathii]|uniref:Cruciform DNA-recognizing protein 1 n=1 Tax=Candida viswanathii TaxID=5486 RepID=A0A367Y3K7_9ASCO|nr:Cruciform DNA-recognizing protein 1 [Candida viswanathii]